MPCFSSASAARQIFSLGALLVTLSIPARGRGDNKSGRKIPKWAIADGMAAAESLNLQTGRNRAVVYLVTPPVDQSYLPGWEQRRLFCGASPDVSGGVGAFLAEESGKASTSWMCKLPYPPFGDGFLLAVLAEA
jgi:hypothetical protein